jgi:hypothetical protein
MGINSNPQPRPNGAFPPAPPAFRSRSRPRAPRAPRPSSSSHSPVASCAPAADPAKPPTPRPAAMNGARRLKRVFGIEIEGCARCGGRLRSSPASRSRRLSRRFFRTWSARRLSNTRPSRRLGHRRRRCSPACYELEGEERFVWRVTAAGRDRLSGIQAQGRAERYAGGRARVGGLSAAGGLSGEASWLPDLPGEAAGGRFGLDMRPVTRIGSVGAGRLNFLSASAESTSPQHEKS